MRIETDYIPGNALLHYRLRLFTEVLAKFVVSAPCAVRIGQLAEDTGHAP